MIAVMAEMMTATLPSTPSASLSTRPLLRGQNVLGQIVALGLVLLGLGCGDEGEPYVPKQPPAGIKADLPAVPSVNKAPIKDGEAYTVWGATYYLRSRVHHNDVAGKDLKITGYVVATNLAEAPKCAIHATGKEDPVDCQAPIPAFWLADAKDGTLQDSIKVEGWASNFAQLYDAVNEYRKRRARKKTNGEPLSDNFWGVKLPNPLPGPGAKVVVTGNYSTAFTRATSGTEADPIMGILTYDEIQYLEPPTELATLPGMRP